MNWTKIVFNIILAITVVAALIFYRWVFSYLVAAVLFSYILDPAVSWLEHRHFPRWGAVVVLYLSVIGLIAWFTSRFIPELTTQANNLLSILGHDDTMSSQYLMQIPFVNGIYEYAVGLDAKIPSLSLAQRFTEVLDGATDFFARLPKFLLDNYSSIIGAISFLGMVPLISFFLLKDKYKIRKSILKLSSNRYFELAIILLGRIDKTVGTYLRAMLFEVIAVSIMASTALSIVGVSNPVLLGISAGVANIIPYFGPFFGGALAVLTVFFEGGPFIHMVYAALAMWMVQVIDNNIVYPVVVGTTIEMHPLLVLLTVLAGGWYGGILWMLVSVPLVYLIYSLISVLYINLKEYRII
ncbi:MAG: AI-2E family transporter [Candidatus Cloacimonetes bacterium]|jgi:predicted PurR-regulated permease PerM|nr:AI-2E family transporter [Candidatus Cloacimonadota bacterium]MDY0298931.1 AI-2E family transporter [Candidatus Cloacimonadaceae bacterium]MCB5280249.1 AI-2E family transporter [Candidatus Cloacimonadota bacterium]MDD2210477.1 AI-2E family transporter [Candidatus Cloacimonadota bacterium]MDD3282173.1 AI-2E family transporter [Candidatus Cloacimonadota bacterium]